MSVSRTVLLKISDNQWLRANGTKLPFVRRAVSKFMPGESFDDMLVAAKATSNDGVRAVFTRLGENVKDLAEADGVARHYLEVIDRIRAMGISCEPSIKLTQLGLDIDRELAFGHLRDLAARAQAAGSYLWIDMEQSSYVDVTLDLTRRLKQEFPAVGVCLQAYLFRTRQDLEDVTARGIGVRLVKGAYNEPATVAFPKKSDVDANYLALAQAMLAAGPRAAGSRAVFGTHDLDLIAAIRSHAQGIGLKPAHYEFHMLYGIQKPAQLRLAQDGVDVRVLIAYGEYWFPWYMRRLAERPANVWFVAKSLFG
jgi:proline dehydrogenase